jgi:hypothetical protein
MNLTFSEAMKAIKRFNDWQKQQNQNGTYGTVRFLAFALFVNTLMAALTVTALLEVAPF